MANTSNTAARTVSTASAGATTFLATMLVNVPLGVWKDVRFAQMYSSAITGLEHHVCSKAMQTTPVRSRVSLAATGTFLFRDGLTIFSSFIMAPYLAIGIPDYLVRGEHAKTVVTQILAPILSQLVATPAHLLGLSLQNWPHRVGIRQRLRDIARDIPATTVVRCIRIVPAFSIGCLLNAELRAISHRFVDSGKESSSID